jgi:fermentation-respiration switch protein FrsA (DUF1100 family)
MRKLMVAAGVFVVLLGAIVAVVIHLQAKLAFPYIPTSAQIPDAVNKVGGESIWLDVDGKRVEAWFLPARHGEAAPLIMNTHGNGELIDQWAERTTPLRDAGFGVLLVEYPGYGRSEGTPSEKSITNTMLAAYDWALKNPRVDPARIVAHGRSMGGGAAGALARNRPLAALVLESTYSSLAAMVRAAGVPNFLIVNRLDTLEALKDYAGPVLVLHGENDNAIPVAHARALASASKRARLEILPCGHNDCPPQWDVVLGFLAQNGVSSIPGKGVSP